MTARKGRPSTGEWGIGAPGLLGIAGGVVVAWFIFLGVLDFIGSRHKAKTKVNMERFASYYKKPPPPVKRKVNGYQVKY